MLLLLAYSSAVWIPIAVATIALGVIIATR